MENVSGQSKTRGRPQINGMWPAHTVLLKFRVDDFAAQNSPANQKKLGQVNRLRHEEIRDLVEQPKAGFEVAVNFPEFVGDHQLK